MADYTEVQQVRRHLGEIINADQSLPQQAGKLPRQKFAQLINPQQTDSLHKNLLGMDWENYLENLLATLDKDTNLKWVILIDELPIFLKALHDGGEAEMSNGPILIAAASRYPEPLSDPGAAFFDFFRITQLEPLPDHEVMTCLRGVRGAGVAELLETDPGRVSALNTMAGGNPRTLGVLYSVLETHMSDDVLAQLQAMLDQFTGWYQARTEELPLQSRAVFDALALNWNPMTAATLHSNTARITC